MAYAPTFVKVAAQGVVNNNAGVTSATFAVTTGGVAAGNMLVVCVMAGDAAGYGQAISSVTDPAGNSYVLQGTRLAGVVNATALTAGQNITVNLAATCYRIACMVLEFSPGAPSAPWYDGHQTGSALSNSTGPANAPSLSPAQADDLIIDVLFWASTSTTYNPTWTPTALWTDRGKQTAFNANANGTYKSVGLGVATRNPNSIGPFTAGGSVDSSAVALFAETVALRGALQHAPNAPTVALRIGFDASTAATFTWTFSDQDAGDTQSAYQLLVLRASDNATIYDSGKLTSATGSHTVPGGSLVNGTTYYWKVRTYDPFDQVGPYATGNRFVPTLPPTLSIDAPVAGSVIASTPATVAWTYSGTLTQSAYQVRLLIAGVQQSSTGKVSNGATRSVTVPVLTATSYTVEVTVWDAQDQPSTPVTVAFTTSFQGAVTPTLTATVNQANARVDLSWTTGAPGAGQAATAYVDLYRAPRGTTTWTRIATGQAASGSYSDYGVADETTYDYKATVTSTAGSTADSTTQSPAAITIRDGIWLHAVSAPASTARNYRYDKGGHGDALGPGPQLVRYDGRAEPVAIFDATAIDQTVTCSLLLPWDLGGSNSSDRVALEALWRRQERVCYRDHRSRVVFGVLAPLEFTDVFRGYTVSLTVTRTAYNEDGT